MRKKKQIECNCNELSFPELIGVLAQNGIHLEVRADHSIESDSFSIVIQYRWSEAVLLCGRHRYTGISGYRYIWQQGDICEESGFYLDKDEMYQSLASSIDFIYPEIAISLRAGCGLWGFMRCFKQKDYDNFAAKQERE